MIRYLVIGFALFCPSLFAQESGEKANFSVRGDVQSRSTFSSATNEFGQILNGNIVFRFKNRDLPFSWTYSERKNTFTHPFNQFRFAPEWKKLKIQIGHCHYFHSAYTLNGAPLLGLGVEIKNRELTYSISSGIIRRKTIAQEGTSGETSYPRRNIIAASVRYEKNKLTVHSNVNLCWDETETNKEYFFSNVPAAQSGFVGSVGLSKTFENGFYVQGEQAFSLVNASRFSGGEFSEFYAINATGFLSAAGKYQLGYRKKSEFILTHERIQKEFHPLSQFYALSDLSVSSIESKLNLKNKKITVRIKGGYQSALSEKSNQRFAGALQLNLNPSRASSFGINYSGFTSISVFNTRSWYEETLYPDDSLRIFQVQHALQAHAVISPGEKSLHRFSFHGTAAAGEQLKGENFSEAYQNGASSQMMNGTISWTKKSRSGKRNTTLGLSNSISGNEKFDLGKTGLTCQSQFNLKKGGKLTFSGIIAQRPDLLSNHRLSYSREWTTFAKSKLRLNFSLSQRMNLTEFSSEHLLLCIQLSVHFS